MDNVKIYYRRLVFFCALFFFSIRGVDAQNTLEESVDLIFQCAVDINLASLTEKSLPEQYILLFKTDRSCIPCYKQLQTHFEEVYPEYDVFIVIIMEEVYLNIDREVASIRNYYPHPTDFILLFKEEEALVCDSSNYNHWIKEWVVSPSPYFLVSTGGRLEWFGLDATMDIVKERGYTDIE